MAPLRSLHIDIEGGRGGSSRSLYQLLSRLDRSRVMPIVAHRETGPLEEWYRNLKIATMHLPEIGSYVPRRENSAKIFIASIPALLKIKQAAARLLHIIEENQIQLIHLNYEGLFLLAEQLKKSTKLPIICHVRSHWPENIWSRWMMHSLARSVDHLIFISPQEESRVRAVGRGKTIDGTMVWNISPQPPVKSNSAYIPEAVYLGNLDSTKGVDRLIDLANALRDMDSPPQRIAIYGESRRARPEYLAGMHQRIANEKLEERIEFRGFTAEPEKVLAEAFALIRPSRENDPWGRDVIEATTFGVPVLATGSFDGVVDHGVTGFLFDPFVANEMAENLVTLVRRPELWQRMSAAASRRGETLFQGSQQAAQVTELFERHIGNGS